jgi:AmmeMemoRadiSam system protein B
MNQNKRAAAVAGAFYSGDKESLRQDLTRLLSDTTPAPELAKAYVLPHAGYVYSGPIAATGYKDMTRENTKGIKRVLLLGPAHRVAFEGIASVSVEYFQTPLGDIPIDNQSLRTIENEFPFVQPIDFAHQQEHSLEVHLPFLQHTLKSFSLIPLVIGDVSPEDVAMVIKHFWNESDTLIIVSSDLSHFLSYEEASRLDQETSHYIESGEYLKLNGHRACGYKGIQGLLLAARDEQRRVKTIDLKNSGDTAGSHDEVVGYGAYAVI